MNTISTIGLLAAASGTCLALPPYSEFTAAEVRVIDADPPEAENVYVVETADGDEIVFEITTDIVTDENAQYEVLTKVETENEGNFVFRSQPEGKHRVRLATPTNKSTHSYMVSQSDDDGSFVIKIEGGKVIQLKHNGDDVPDNRFSFEDGVIVILDSDGKKITEHNIHAFGPGANARFGAPPHAANAPKVLRFGAGAGGNFVFGPGDDHDVRFFTDGSGNQVTWDFQPKVMVGINQGVPGAALRHHLNLGADQPCILIEKVIEGLPAAAAGLKQYDIVIKADGKKVNDGVLRELLSEKEPGERMTFKVIRKGEPMQIVIDLEAYDGERLSPNVQFFGNVPSAPMRSPGENVIVRSVPAAGWVSAPDAPNATGTWVSAPDAPSGVISMVGPHGEVIDLDAPHAVREFVINTEDFTDPAKVQVLVRQLQGQMEERVEHLKLEGNRLFISEDFPVQARTRVLREAHEAQEQAVEARTAANFVRKSSAGNVRRAAPESSERLEKIENRLERLEDSLADRLDRLFNRLDSITEQLEEITSDSEEGEI